MPVATVHIPTRDPGRVFLFSRCVLRHAARTPRVARAWVPPAGGTAPLYTAVKRTIGGRPGSQRETAVRWTGKARHSSPTSTPSRATPIGTGQRASRHSPAVPAGRQRAPVDACRLRAPRQARAARRASSAQREDFEQPAPQARQQAAPGHQQAARAGWPPPCRRSRRCAPRRAAGGRRCRRHRRCPRARRSSRWSTPSSPAAPCSAASCGKSSPRCSAARRPCSSSASARPAAACRGEGGAPEHRGAAAGIAAASRRHGGSGRGERRARGSLCDVRLTKCLLQKVCMISEL